MKRHLRRTTVRVVLIVVSAVGAVLWTIDTVWSMQEPKGVAHMSKQMKTVCVGRFLIDVPLNARVTLGSARLGGFDIANYGVESRDDFTARLLHREEAINAEKTRAGKKNMVSVQTVHHADVDGKIFIFGFNSGYLIENGVKVTYTDVSIEGFVQINAFTIRFAANASTPADVVQLERLLKQLRRLDAGNMPKQPGFCMDGFFVREPLTADQRESIVMFAAMPNHEDLGIALATMAGDAPGPGLIERSKANRAGPYAFLNLMTSTLLEGSRTINGLEGDEFAFKARERNFSTGYAFNWETQGKEDDVLRPFISLELQTGISPRAGGQPVQSTLSEESVGELWRGMSSSLRLRPVEQAAVVDVDLQRCLALGTLAWAGNTCPQTGWWQCGQADAQLGVFGGERQFFREGQVVPQALLLPKPTIWQKVRGLQPSYETSTPSNWRLADKRSGARRVPAARLAEARPGGAGHVGSTALIALGRTLRSGEQCPVSGWWLCTDEEALDKTRWFAGSVVLPVASYQLTGGSLKRRVRTEHLVQRPAAWRLMRLERDERVVKSIVLDDAADELLAQEQGVT